MRVLLLAATCCSLVLTVFAAEGVFNYLPATVWDKLCKKGERQSPINISPKDAIRAPKEAGHVEITSLGVVKSYNTFFTGVSLQVDFEEWDEEPEIRIPANAYSIGDSNKVKPGDMLELQPLQMHYHTFSEHTVDGFYAPGEIHIVTKVKDGESDYCDNTGGCLAVFGLLTVYKHEGEKTKRFLETLFSETPKLAGHDNGLHREEKLKLDNVMPHKLDYYTYLGSLTTPPCSETVTWHVFKHPVAIAANVVDKYQEMVSFTPGTDCTFAFHDVCTPPREKTNHRQVQPLYGREVYLVEYDE